MDIPQGRKQAPGQSKRQVEKIQGKNGRTSTPKGRNISHTNPCESLRYYKPTLGPIDLIVLPPTPIYVLALEDPSRTLFLSVVPSVLRTRVHQQGLFRC